jgi:hypothetical protein
MTKMMRISDVTYKHLDALSKDADLSKQDLMEMAVKYLTKKYFLEKTHREYEALKKNTKQWKAYLKEQKEWDCCLLDGLEGL